MPTYGYRCPACGHEYEKLQRINDASRVPCPECGTEGERLISGGSGIVFKGSGFYETDYKRAGSAKPKDEKKKETPTKSDKPSKSDGGSKPKSAKGGDA